MHYFANLVFRLCLCFFTGARHGYAVCCIGLSLGCGQSHLLSTEMDFDAWASFGCLCIALDALRIVWDVLCIVCDAWASFDACASCVEPGTPWVTEASSFAVFFFFFFSFAVSGFIMILKFIYLWIPLDLTSFLMRWMMDVMAVWTLCCAIDCCRFYPPLTVVGTVFIAV